MQGVQTLPSGRSTRLQRTLRVLQAEHAFGRAKEGWSKRGEPRAEQKVSPDDLSSRASKQETRTHPGSALRQ